jgi:hypothetical protein
MAATARSERRIAVRGGIDWLKNTSDFSRFLATAEMSPPGSPYHSRHSLWVASLIDSAECGQNAGFASQTNETSARIAAGNFSIST